MNFINKRSYKDIGLFQITEDNIIYVVSNSNRSNLYEIRGNDFFKIFESGDKILGTYKEKDSLWFITPKGTFEYQFNKTIKKIDNLWFQQIIEIPNYLFIKADKNDQDCFCIYDIQNKEIIWEIAYGSTTYLATKTNLFLALSGKSVIRCYSYTSTNTIWEYDISEIGRYIPLLEETKSSGKISKIIGTYQNQLIVLLKGGKFISLDINTGHLLWEKHTIDINNTSQDIDYGFSDPTFPFYDKEKGEIYILQGDSFIFFDLKSGLASYEWTSNDPKEERSIFVRNSGLYKDKIHFTARLENSATYDVIGIFDITQRKIIWQYKFGLDKYNNILQTQMNDTHFYALDGENNLYVFEKEINNQIYD